MSKNNELSKILALQLIKMTISIDGPCKIKEIKRNNETVGLELEHIIKSEQEQISKKISRSIKIYGNYQEISELIGELSNSDIQQIKGIAEQIVKKSEDFYIEESTITTREHKNLQYEEYPYEVYYKEVEGFKKEDGSYKIGFNRFCIQDSGKKYLIVADNETAVMYTPDMYKIDDDVSYGEYLGAFLGLSASPNYHDSNFSYFHPKMELLKETVNEKFDIRELWTENNPQKYLKPLVSEYCILGPNEPKTTYYIEPIERASSEKEIERRAKK